MNLAVIGLRLTAHIQSNVLQLSYNVARSTNLPLL